MSDFYADMADTADEMISEFGRDITIHRKQSGTFSASANGFIGGSTALDIPAKAVFTKFRDSQIDGEMVKRTDKRVLVTRAVQKNDILIDGTTKYTVVDVETVQPGSLPLIYKAQARK